MGLIARDVSGTRFDSTLNTDEVDENHNADLILKVRTRVVAHPLESDPLRRPGLGSSRVAFDYAHTPIPAVELTESDLSTAFETVKQKTESRWNGQLWLIPDPPLSFYHVFENNRTRAICPFIYCTVRILSCPAGATPHLTIKLVQRRDPNEFFRSSAGGGEMTLDDGDLSDDKTIAHEMGHHLGLDHVHNQSSACLSDPNQDGTVGDDDVCYGSTEWAHDNVMGDGTRVEAWNSWPWRRRMNRHWDIGHDWTRQPPPPHTRDNYHEPRGRPRPRVIRLFTVNTSSFNE